MTPTTHDWLRTATGRVAHAVSAGVPMVGVCLAMPLETSANWSPERTRRYYERGEGEWVNDSQAPRCRTCERIVTTPGRP